MPTFRECGQRSSPECVGSLKSHRPWSVSGVPSMSKHDTTLGSKQRRVIWGIGPGSYSELQPPQKSRAPVAVDTIPYWVSQLNRAK